MPNPKTVDGLSGPGPTVEDDSPRDKESVVTPKAPAKLDQVITDMVAKGKPGSYFKVKRKSDFDALVKEHEGSPFSFIHSPGLGMRIGHYGS